MSNTTTIGPEQAAELLALNTNNYRRLNLKHVNDLAAEMAAGNWGFTGEPIIIGHDEHGTEVLLDGQHRLSAIVVSRCTLPFVIIRGIAADMRTKIDIGKPRNSADELRHLGIRNCTETSSAATMVMRYEDGAYNSSKYHDKKYTKGYNVAAHVMANRELYDAISDTSSQYRHTGLNKSAVIAFYVIAMRAGNSQELVDSYLEAVKSGANLAVNSPAWAVREWALRRQIRSGGTDKKYSASPQHLCALIKGFNAWVKGTQIGNMKVWTPTSVTSFPTIVTA